MACSECGFAESGLDDAGVVEDMVTGKGDCSRENRAANNGCTSGDQFG